VHVLCIHFFFLFLLLLFLFVFFFLIRLSSVCGMDSMSHHIQFSNGTGVTFTWFFSQSQLHEKWTSQRGYRAPGLFGAIACAAMMASRLTRQPGCLAQRWWELVIAVWSLLKVQF
jgi:hypothetical protein